MLAASLSVVLAVVGEVSLTVEPKTPCLELATLESALRARGLVVREAAGPSTLVAKVAPTQGGVGVQGLRAGRRFERVVPTSGACPAVERVVVALLESWVAAPAVRAATARDAGVTGTILERDRAASDARQSDRVDADGASRARVDGGAARVERELRAVDGPSSTSAGGAVDGGLGSVVPDGGIFSVVRLVSVARATEAPPAASSMDGSRGTDEAPRTVVVDGGLLGVGRAPARGSGASSTSEVDGGLLSVRVQDEVRLAASLPSPRPSPHGEREDLGASPTSDAPPDGGSTTQRDPALSLEVSVLGGATLDASAMATGAGALAVRGGLGRWGVLLDVGLDSARTGRPVEAVTASATSQWLSASFSVAFVPREQLSLDVALGLRGWRIAATAVRVDVRTDRVVLSWGGVLSAGLSWRLTGPLLLQVRPFAALRSEERRFSVEPLGTVLTLNPLIFGVLAGAAVRL